MANQNFIELTNELAANENGSFQDSDQSWNPEGEESADDSDEDKMLAGKLPYVIMDYDALNVENTLHECWICENLYDSENTLNVHISSEHHLGEIEMNSQKLKCEFCDSVYPNRTLLKKHYESHSEDKINQCQDCGIRFESYFDLEQHNATENCKNESFICCGEVFTRRMDFILHKRANHGRIENLKKQFSCNKCGKDFPFISHLRNHRKSCLNLNISALGVIPSCCICAQTFNSRSSLYLHMHDSHPNEPSFPCKHCSETLSSIPDLKFHQKQHQTKNPTCQFCQKTFKDQQTYLSHRQVHLKDQEKKNVCSFCGKELCSSIALQVHIKTHTGDRPFQCHYCQKTFIQKQSMIAHFRSHTKERAFSCSICSKTFTYYSSMKCHERIHTGVKPYQCQFCPKTFNRYGTYQNHVRLHTGEKPFECHICGKRFAQKSTQNSHVKTHDKQRSNMAPSTSARGRKSKGQMATGSNCSPNQALNKPNILEETVDFPVSLTNVLAGSVTLVDHATPKQPESSIMLLTGGPIHSGSNVLYESDVNEDENVVTKIILTGNIDNFDASSLSRVLFTNKVSTNGKTDFSNNMFVCKTINLASMNQKLSTSGIPETIFGIGDAITADKEPEKETLEFDQETSIELQDGCLVDAFYAKIKSLEGH